jgi:lysophospholipase L1-like esterase
MKRSLPLASLAALACTGPAITADFQFKDGDRVVLVGSTLIEREQRYGYWEAALTTRHPDKNITFRNLGWSGDTVWGESRVGFDLDNPKIGFQRLVEHVLALKPTVIIVGYGTNESFAGKEGLPRFKEGMNKLLDAFAPTKARIVLLSPVEHEFLGRPLPDPAPQNKRIALYRDVLREVARKRDATFLDLSKLFHLAIRMGDGSWTEDSMHLTAYGYWASAGYLLRGSVLGLPEWALTLDGDDGKILNTEGLKAEKLDGGKFRYRVKSEILPLSLSPRGSPRGASHNVRRILVEDMPAGRYELRIDGKAAAVHEAKDLRLGVFAKSEFDQAEKLRKLIVEKNRLYFHRWRPENETYLFGFRKHEQGKNAVEIPKFDPLIEKLEKEIAKLRVPVAHKYELVPVK